MEQMAENSGNTKALEKNKMAIENTFYDDVKQY